MPARTRVAATVKVQLDAGQANPGKVGQSLGHTGIKHHGRRHARIRHRPNRWRLPAGRAWIYLPPVNV
jgi:hypothetical protein